MPWTTGESPTLTADEHDRLLEAVIARATDADRDGGYGTNAPPRPYAARKPPPPGPTQPIVTPH